MIDKWLNKIDRLNQNNLFWWIVATSILLAAWMQYIQHGWINPDSVLYFEQARLFSLGDWTAGFNIFEWPLYGACIGFLHKLTSLPIQTSAQLLNMLFFGIATASFLQLIKLAGGNSRTLFAGALLLFSSQYIVGDVLEMLMRDEGFWAFYLTALVFFIRYIQGGKLSDALYWQLCIIVATLFRIEAILFLMLLPLTCLLVESPTLKYKFQNLLYTYSISIIIAIVITITLLTQPQLSLSQFGRLNEVFTSNLYQEFTQKLLTQADIMSNQVLGKYLEEFAIPGLLLTFLCVMGSKIITATGLIGTSLAMLGLRRSPIKIHPKVKLVLAAASIIALISMALIIIKVFVLSSRYVVELAWLLLIFASFYLTSLSLNTNKKPRIIFLILCLVLSLGVIKNVLPKRDGYNYQQDAVRWVKVYNKGNKPVFYDDSRMIYYAKSKFSRKWDDNWKVALSAINQKTLTKNKFLLLSHSKKHMNRLTFIRNKLPGYKEIKRFNNYRAKKFIVIYQKTLPIDD
ncbi:MAG: hypothetical protein ACKE5M_06015 [Methylophilaceae bacterium]